MPAGTCYTYNRQTNRCRKLTPMIRSIPATEFHTFFTGIAALPQEERERANVQLIIQGEDVINERVQVLGYLPDDNAEDFSVLVVETMTGEVIASRIEDITGVVFTDVDEVDETQSEELTLVSIAEFPSDATVSFTYTTARGTTKSVTGLTPAFVRPSETHSGRFILVGFLPQEDGAFARKTFRTDRITDFIRDAA
jgi:hypothetical protein